MKMKNIITLTLIMVICFPGVLQAQKLKKEAVGKYTYIQSPIDIRLVGSETYKVVGHGDYVDSYEKDKMNEAINLAGFEKKDRNTNTVDFKVDVEKYSIKFGDSKKNTRVSTTKKDGVETKTNYYSYSCPATFKYILRIYKGSEDLFKKENAGDETVTGGESTSSNTAWEKFSTAKKEYKSKVTAKKLEPLNSAINDKFGFPEKVINMRSAHLKPKKHNYDDYDKVFEHMKEGYIIVAADENNVEEAKDAFTKSIEGFEMILKESDPENKKARINNDITALLYLNIGHCYFLMKDYTEASKKYAKAMVYKKGILDAKSLKIKSDDLFKRVEANML